MLRRLATANAPLASNSTVARRAYTEYDHRKYPALYQVVYGIPLYYSIMWFTLLLAGSVVTKRSEWKKDYLRYWRRRKGTGYKWGNDFGPEITNTFKNLPSRAE
jgi:hypothetical protein